MPDAVTIIYVGPHRSLYMSAHNARRRLIRGEQIDVPATFADTALKRDDVERVGPAKTPKTPKPAEVDADELPVAPGSLGEVERLDTDTGDPTP